MNFIKKKISDLNPAEYNPRVDLVPGEKDYEDLKRSILEFGYIDPIIVNKDGTIIGGHQRYKILLDLGYKEIDVVELDVTKDKEKALNIALNKISGDWDNEKLKNILKELDLGDFDITLTGFTHNELDDLIAEIEIPEIAEDDDFDVDEQYNNIETPKTKLGDIYILGNHRLMCGDSTSISDVNLLMDGAKANLVVTDPPYNVNYGDKAEYLEDYLGKGSRNVSKIKNDNMSAENFYNFMFEVYKRAYEVMLPGAAIYVFHSENESVTFRKAFMEAGLKLAQCLIWEKNTFVLGRQDYQWRHEPILYGWKEGSAHYFINDRTQDTVIVDDEIDYKSMKKQELIALIDDLHRKYSDMTSVIFEKKPTKNDIHPTMKPVSLVGRLIKNSSKANWNVVDLFGGGGSTLIASEQLRRNSYIMELDEKYCDVMVTRWEEFTGQKAKKI